MLKIIDIDEDFFLEDLFAHGDGTKSIDEMREDVEWRICEYYDEHEAEDAEPVISPFSLYMLGFMERRKSLGDIAPWEMRRALRAAWDARDLRIGKFINRNENETTKGN